MIDFRNLLSDFAVVIAIFTMTMVSYFADVHTPKLVSFIFVLFRTPKSAPFYEKIRTVGVNICYLQVVPSEFKPTWEGRDWIVTHALIFADHLLTNPW